MEITTDMIKELRNATKAGVLDCRKALTEADGDFQKAVDWLREKGMATAAKRSDREASQGVVELYSHGGGRVGNRRIVCRAATTEVLTPENLAAMYGSDAHLFRHTPADGHGHLHEPGD